MEQNKILTASFRDPSGFLFFQNKTLYRQVNREYQSHYDHLMSSGLFDRLTKKGWLIPHERVDITPPIPELAYLTIQPLKVDFISYPYEWSFSQLKDSALLTLSIQKSALESGMVLKDASAYNIQFHNGSPILIDTLSFEIYEEGLPWIAYRQFCQHFLAPLALMAKRDIRLGQLMRIYIDGIPLDLASELLPGGTRFNFGLLTHIHLHAGAQKRYADKPINTSGAAGKMGKTALLGLIDSLENTVKQLAWLPGGTEWAEYYEDTNYTSVAFEKKKQVVGEFLNQAKPQVVWDLGANTGVFSQVSNQQNALTISFDIDPAAVEKNYRYCKDKKTFKVLPLVLDLTNPSPALGWGNKERMSITERAPADVVMALALVHHLAISNNVPLLRLAETFSILGKWLIIEFVPKDDSQVQRLLVSRKDIFPNYTQEGFEAAFNVFYHIKEIRQLGESKRILYLLENRTS
jgi:hypothetical protein